MDRLSADQLDRQLGSWLREESATRAPAGLVEDVFARTSQTRQARRWWPPVRLARSGGAAPARLVWARPQPLWRRASAFAGAIAIVLVVVALGLALRPGGTGPGTVGSPSALPSPSLSEAPSVSPSVRGSPTPEPTVLGTLAATSLALGPDAAPIGVTEAFGSIWVADIHAGDVRRYEPATMRELARISVPGAAWFAVADGALWVTQQTATGLSRIDPATNTVVAHVGDVPPCGAPVVVANVLWQSACDADVFLRIDPTRNAVAERIPAQGHTFLVLARGQLITTGPEGLASLDPNARTFRTIGNPAAIFPDFVASDGTTVWVKDTAGVARIDPADGRTVASLSSPQAQVVTFAGDHAWLSVTRQGVLEIDLATTKVTRTIPVQPAPLVPIEAGGALWVTDFDSSALWRIDL